MVAVHTRDEERNIVVLYLVLRNSEMKVRESTSKLSAIRVFIGLPPHLSFPLLHYNLLFSSSLCTIFIMMTTPGADLDYFSICFECFLFGKLSVLCASAFTLAISC